MNPESLLDSLTNLYDAYRQTRLGNDPVAARALYEVLCDHGWWGPDGMPVADAGPTGRVQPRFIHSPSPASGPVRFDIQASVGSGAPTVEVFDVAGRTLWREVAAAAGGGIWRATWPAGARPGIYFARCRAQGIELRRTIVLRR